MKKTLMSILILAGLSYSTAYACTGKPPPGCSCNTSTNQWTYNTYNTDNSTHNSATGGTGVGIGVGGSSNSNSSATGGAVNNSGNSSNTNTNNNSNVAQGGTATGGSATIAKGAVTNNNTVSGGAGGAGGNASIAKGAVQNHNTNSLSNSGNSAVTGSGNSSIAAGAVQNTVASNSEASNNGSNNTTAATVGNVSTGASTASASADGAGANNGNNSNNTQITYKAARIPVSTAYAASLTSGMDTCLGSTSGGVQTQILGLSIGGTHTDENCVLVKQTQLLLEMNQERAACFRARAGKVGKAIDDAMNAAGAECPPLVPVQAAIVVGPAPDVVSHAELAEIEKRIIQHSVSK